MLNKYIYFRGLDVLQISPKGFLPVVYDFSAFLIPTARN